jgi:FMN phosphatase YigB (HAD superfamily)
MLTSIQRPGGAQARRQARAVLFDLDDTLYPERRFMLSGFAAVARDAAETGMPEREAFRLLVGAWRAGRRHAAFQDLCARVGLPTASTVARWVTVFRTHQPRLRLPAISRQLLASLSASWAIGVVTNGLPAVQHAKIRALGLAPLVEAVVLAAEVGSGRGKPDSEPFLVCLDQHGVTRRTLLGTTRILWDDLAAVETAPFGLRISLEGNFGQRLVMFGPVMWAGPDAARAEHFLALQISTRRLARRRSFAVLFKASKNTRIQGG